MSEERLRAVVLVDALDEKTYGGKCVSLGFALRAGLPVPPGYALGVELVNALAAGDCSAAAVVSPVFSDLAPTVAVRSSAVGEDSVEASFAGQHLSVLNVMSAESMLEAIKKVHASAFTEEAIAYRHRMVVKGEPAIAVAIQKQIHSDVAGVMFTKNPLSGAEERYIEGSWGLGEAVVAGMVVPDSYRISATGDILEQVLGEKDVELVANSLGDTIEQSVDEQRVSSLCLGPPELEKLHGLALDCEAIYGEGLDIEWAFHSGRLYLLQCRSITH